MRTDGYAPIADYAAVGDGRTVALVARDGSVDWLCLPDLDSPSVFAALLDADNGGRFSLAPTDSFEAERRYVPDTNVLETTFRTARATVRVTDALTIPGSGLEPVRELVRRVECLDGEAQLAWEVEPCFRYATRKARVRAEDGAFVLDAGSDAVALRTWGTGESKAGPEGASGSFGLRGGERALLVLAGTHQEPLVLPGRDDAEGRLDGTVAFWRRWTSELTFEGPWRDEVLRSVLLLKLLVHSPSGAIAAAATTSLPETLGGSRNWDYRFAWVRDSALTLDALLEVGAHDEAHAFFWWLMQASQLTHPKLQTLYELDGGNRAPERTLPLAGYRSSPPVRIGNGAVDQTQLDIYGDLLQMAALYVDQGRDLDRDTAGRFAEIAELVCSVWVEPDYGIWEVRSEPRHFTQSKMMCCVGLERACKLASAAKLPAERAAHWRHEAAAIRRFVEERCYSAERGAYVRSAEAEELDASVLLAAILGYWSGPDERALGTIDAVKRELGQGPFLYRYLGDDGLPGEEGAFLACSFWLVEALARVGRADDAAETMEELLRYANDVGLYAEEIDPETGEFLGNFPQGLTHLALVSAAGAVAEATP
jgi:GH15 family glucan-1,4-alpha-glucosidase